MRPLSRAPAAGVALTRRRNAVPSPCTPTLENYSPSLKGARYPTSMGDGLQRSFAGCDTGKPAPGGAPPLTVSPPTATPDASRGTDWVFLGFGRAGGTRSAPPLSASPDPMHPPQGRYGRSPHGSLDGPPPVAPPHSGVKAFDFGPGGGLGSEGLDHHRDGVPDAVALEIRDRLGAYPGLLPGESPDPDLRTRQPAGALDALDLVGAGVRTPAPRPVLSPALGRGAPGAFALDTGPAIAARQSDISRGTPQRSLGGGGGGPSPAVAAVLAADAAVKHAQAGFQYVEGLLAAASPEQAEVLHAVAAKLEQEWADAVSARDRLGDPEQLDRHRRRSKKDRDLQLGAEIRSIFAEMKRFSARVRKFGALSGFASGVARAEAYGQARDDLDRARGQLRNEIREARNALLDLRGKEDKEATKQRIAALEAAVAKARADGDAMATLWAEGERALLGEFENLIRSADEAAAQAESARESFEDAANELRKASLRGGDIAAATKALNEAREEVRKALDWLLKVMILIDEATRLTRPPDPPEKIKGGGTRRKGPRLPWWVCSGPFAKSADCKGREWCPKCGPYEKCDACRWVMVPSEGAGGGKGKVLGREGASFGSDARKVDPSLLRAKLDTAPKANYHRPETEGVRTPPDGAAAGVGPQAMGPYGGAPIPYYASPQASPADDAVPAPQPAVAPGDSQPSLDSDLQLLRARVEPWRVERVNAMVRTWRQQEEGPNRVLHSPRFDNIGLQEVGLSTGAFQRLVNQARWDEARTLHSRNPRYDPLGRAPERAVLTALAGADRARADESQEGFTYSGVALDVARQGLDATTRAGEGLFSGAVGVGGLYLSAHLGGPFTEAGRTAFQQAARALGAAEEAFAGRAEAERIAGMRSEPGAVATSEGHMKEFAREAAGGRLLDIESPQDEGSVLRAAGQLSAEVGPVAIDIVTPVEGLVRSVQSLRVLHALRLKQAGRVAEFEAIHATMRANELEELRRVAAAMPGGGTGGAGRSGVVAEGSVAGVGDEVPTGAKGGAADAPPKTPDGDEAVVAPADSRATPPDGPPPKEEPKTEPEEVKPEDQTPGTEEQCKCKTGEDSTEDGGVEGGAGLSSGGRPSQTGGSLETGANTPEEAWAAKRYDEIRADSGDIQRIADSTGLRTENVEKVKQHVFFDEHLKDRYVHTDGEPPEIGRFDPSPRQVEIWERLQRGDHTPSDIAWLKHEVAERKAMELSGSRSYDAAHRGVSPRWPSPLERRNP